MVSIMRSYEAVIKLKQLKQFLRNNNYIKTRKIGQRYNNTIFAWVLHYSQKSNLAKYFSSEIFRKILYN